MEEETRHIEPQLVRFGPMPHQVLHVQLVEELLIHMRERHPKQFGDALREVIVGQNGTGR